MKMNFKDFRGAAQRMETNLQQLRRNLADIRREGRSEEWTKRSAKEAIMQASDQLRKEKAKAQTHLIREKATARDIVEEPHDHSRRLYHLQKAKLLAEGKTPQQLRKLYEQVATNQDSRRFKNEYRTIFDDEIQSKGDGGDIQLWEETKQKYFNEKEQQQQKYQEALDQLEAHLQTVTNTGEMEINEIMEKINKGNIGFLESVDQEVDGRLGVDEILEEGINKILNDSKSEEQIFKEVMDQQRLNDITDKIKQADDGS